MKNNDICVYRCNIMKQNTLYAKFKNDKVRNNKKQYEDYFW